MNCFGNSSVRTSISQEVGEVVSEYTWAADQGEVSSFRWEEVGWEGCRADGWVVVVVGIRGI